METSLWLLVASLLTSLITWFLKRIIDNTEKMIEDVQDMKPKVDALWEEVFSSTNSPRQLNERGGAILEKSGIKEIVESNQKQLLDLVKKQDPQSPYDAEQIINDVVMDLPQYHPEFLPQLKQGAFETGVHISAILFVGSLHLRNIIFNDLGFSLKDLDHKN